MSHSYVSYLLMSQSIIVLYVSSLFIFLLLNFLFVNLPCANLIFTQKITLHCYFLSFLISFFSLYLVNYYYLLLFLYFSYCI